MSLDTLGEEIRKKAEGEVAKIRDKTDSEAKRRLKEAEGKRSEILKEAEVAGAIDSKAVVQMELSAATIRAKRMVMVAREQVVECALEDVWKGLLDYRETREYKQFFRDVVKNAVREMGDGILVCARREDKPLVGKHKVRFIDCAGGAVIESKDGRIVLDYTFESLFNDKKGELREILYKKIFEK